MRERAEERKKDGNHKPRMENKALKPIIKPRLFNLRRETNDFIQEIKAAFPNLPISRNLLVTEFLDNLKMLKPAEKKLENKGNLWYDNQSKRGILGE
jgi:hypothetical protein